MSLHGVVFRKLSKIEERYGKGVFTVDEDGQAYPIADPDYPEDWEPEFERAVSERIGNVALVEKYLRLVRMHLPGGLVEGILRHQIQKTPLSELLALEGELSQLSKIPELTDLSDDMLLLIRVARTEGNPIVWI
jgi:hypothetical protein